MPFVDRFPTDLISIHALREDGDRGKIDAPELMIISIHALREEGDVTSGLLCFPVLDFYPRPPRGGRPAIPL